MAKTEEKKQAEGVGGGAPYFNGEYTPEKLKNDTVRILFFVSRLVQHWREEKLKTKSTCDEIMDAVCPLLRARLSSMYGATIPELIKRNPEVEDYFNNYDIVNVSAKDVSLIYNADAWVNDDTIRIFSLPYGFRFTNQNRKNN